MDSKHICPMCEEGTLSEVTYSDVLQIRGVDRQLDGLVMSVCSHCGEESMTASQLKANGRTMAAARAQAIDEERAKQGLLVSGEVRALRKKLGLTQQQASQVFGGGPNAFSKYERGEVLQSDLMDKLLRLSAELPVAANWLFAKAGMTILGAKETEAASARNGVFLDFQGMRNPACQARVLEVNDSYSIIDVWHTVQTNEPSQGGAKTKRNLLVQSAGIVELKESREWETSTPLPMAAGWS